MATYSALLCAAALLLVAAMAVVSAGDAPTFVASPSGTKGTIKLAAVLPLNEVGSTKGQAALEGIKMAANDAKSMLPNYKIEVYAVDSKCDPAVAGPATKKLLAQGRFAAVIGDMCSTSTAAIKDNAPGVPVVSPASSLDKLSVAGDNLLRMVPPDRFQAPALANLVATDNGGKPVVGVAASNDAYGTNLAQRLSDALKTKAPGARVLPTQLLSADNPKTVADQLVKDGATAVVVTATRNNMWSAELVAALAAKGYKGALFGSDSMADAAFAKIVAAAGGGDAASKLLSRIVVVGYNRGDKDFQEAFRAAAPGVTYQGSAAAAYDAVNAVLRAFKADAVAASTGKPVSAAKVQAQTFAGKTGQVKFDAAGDAVPSGQSYEKLGFAQQGMANKMAGTVIPWVLVPQGFVSS